MFNWWRYTTFIFAHVSYLAMVKNIIISLYGLGYWEHLYQELFDMGHYILVMVIIYGNYLAMTIISNNADVIIESIILILLLFMVKAFVNKWRPSICILIYILTWCVLIIYIYIYSRNRTLSQTIDIIWKQLIGINAITENRVVIRLNSAISKCTN